MNQSPFEILAGPLTLWLAPVGTAFPLVTALPAAGWIKVGTNGDGNYSDDGVIVNHVQKIEGARPAGHTGQVKAWRTEEDLILSLTLWDLSLEQYATALNKAVITTTAASTGQPGTKAIGLSMGQDVTQYALLARGASPYGDNMSAQYEVPRCYQSANAKITNKKGKPSGLDLEFTALVDLAATTPDKRFGRLVAQHQAAL